MKEKPRSSKDFIITPAMTRSILGVAALFVVVLLGMLFWFGSAITPYELSAFFTVFVMLQFWNMFNAKRICFIDAFWPFRGADVMPSSGCWP